MKKFSILAVLCTGLLAPLSLVAGAQVFKCSNNGSVSYQHDPCPSGEVRRDPTIEQLNAERQKNLRQAEVRPPSSSATSSGNEFSSSSGGSSGGRGLGSPGEKARTRSALAPDASANSESKCDGRSHCSQMTSCVEAQYFLRHCPGVQMDGDGNGVPCEKQWCKGLKSSWNR